MRWVTMVWIGHVCHDTFKKCGLKGWLKDVQGAQWSGINYEGIDIYIWQGKEGSNGTWFVGTKILWSKSVLKWRQMFSLNKFQVKWIFKQLDLSFDEPRIKWGILHNSILHSLQLSYYWTLQIGGRYVLLKDIIHESKSELMTTSIGQNYLLEHLNHLT